MGNVLAIVLGAICGIIGIAWTIGWWGEFVALFKGCVGITLFFGGLLALAIGISEMKASKEFEKMAPPAAPASPEPAKEESKPAESAQ